jgi:hypothetical protein
MKNTIKEMSADDIIHHSEMIAEAIEKYLASRGINGNLAGCIASDCERVVMRELTKEYLK